MKDKEWRMNHLYWIKDEKGDRVKFRMNWAQKILFHNLWFKNIILKARQLGITTFFCLYFLDDVIFEGKDAGLIAHTLKDAIRIFDTKIQYPWDNLSSVIRESYDVNTENARQLQLSKENMTSSIYIGTSLRSGTVQRLHVSELGTIDQKFPKKAKEIKSGALNTIHKNQIVTIESTAKGESGLFYELCQEAKNTAERGKKLSWMDYKLFFFPWYKHPKYQLEGDYGIPQEKQDYFRKLKEKGIHLTKAQKNWYVKKEDEQDDDMKSEFPSTPEEAFEVSTEGAYYAKQMRKVRSENRIVRNLYDPKLPVKTYWDLGVAANKKDAVSIIFVQDHRLEIRIIDFESDTGEGLAYYAKLLDRKPYVYDSHWAPHDIKVKELGTGKTRFDVAAGLGINFNLVPKIGFNDGIEAARMIFSKCYFDEENTKRLRKALQNYKKQWDDTRGRFKNKPFEDWTADPADAFRYMAVAHPDHMKLGYFDEEEKELEKIRRGQGSKWDPNNPFKMR